MNWKKRIESAFEPARLDDDVLEELAQHAAATYAAARAEGCDAAHADARVDRQIAAWTANPALLRRRPKREPAVVPPAVPGSPLGSILQDLRYSWRLLRRQPAYAALVVATMTMGIASTTVLGSVAYGVLLKPLPWADAPRLVRLYETRQGSTRRLQPVMTNGLFLAWRDAPSSTLDALGAWSVRTAILSDGENAQQLRVAGVTPGMIDLVGGRPAIGRLFVDDDARAAGAAAGSGGADAKGPPQVAIISHGLWQQRFGGRADAIGQTLRLDGASYEVVGVMPASFGFPDRATRAWLPFLVRPMTVPGRPGASLQMFQAVGRMRDGVTPQQVAAEGTARGAAVPTNNAVTMAVFGSNGALEVTALPLLEALTGEVRPAILVMLAAVLLLLATATANVASLQLARATARRREMAVRAALGAGRGRLVRQTLVENLLLGALGGLAGLALALAMHRALPSVLPADFPRLEDLAIDARLPLLALAVSIGAGLGCGLLPAIHVARTDLVPALVEDSLAPVGGGLRARTARVRALIMAAQIAIAFVLLAGASLLVRSFTGMMRADVGYDATSVLTARLILPDGDYTPQRRQQTIDRLMARVASIPSIRLAAYSTVLPFTAGEMLASFPLRGRDGKTIQVQTGARQVSAGYFAAMGQKVVEGREFTPEDSAGSQEVAIVNREFARKYLEGRALGWSLPAAQGPDGKPRVRPIVGVVQDTVRRSITDTPQPEIYAPAPQQPMLSSNLHLILRTTTDPASIVPTLRSLVRETAPAAPLESIMTMEDRLSESLAKPRLYALLLGTFAAFALAIAGVGLFGILSYSVAQRAREIGVRAALGAQVRDIVALVLRQSLAIAGTGVAAGIVASFWVTGALRRFLYGVEPRDAVSLGLVAFTLLAVAAVATIVPARRAARVDPVRVLRG